MSKQPKVRRLTYKRESLDNALKDIRKGMPISTASTKHNVPRTTLFNKINTKYADKKPGPQTILSADEENCLVNWIISLSERGFPVTKQQLINSVQLIVRNLERENPFKDDRPGRHWYNGFLNRHQHLCARMSENVSRARAKVSEKSLREWFSTIKSYLEEKNLLNIHPSRVFNADETAVLLNPKAKKVIVSKGSRNVYNIVGDNEKESLTALITGNAAGQLAPPLVLFAYKRIPTNIYKKMPKGWCYGKSDSGWMTGESFYEFMANTFINWIKTSGLQLPIVMYIDGHSSHMTQPMSALCMENQIELIALHPNATHIIQPMDVCLFYPLKLAWKKELNKYRAENDVLCVLKEDAASLLNKALNSMNVITCLENGFRKCGLCPFSADAVDYTRCFKKISNDPPTTAEDASINTTEYNVTLKTMKAMIHPDTIQAFVRAKDLGEWMGNSEDKNLFNFWKQVCDLSQVITVNNTTKDQIEVTIHACAAVVTASEITETEVNGNEFIIDETENIIISFVDEAKNITEKLPEQCVLNDKENYQSNNTVILDSDYILDISNAAETQPLIEISNNIPPKESAKPLESMKSYLYWPGQKSKENAKDGKKQREQKERPPSVLTSEQYQVYCLEKERKKQEADRRVLENKLKAQKRKLEVEEKKRRAREQVEIKKRIKVEKMEDKTKAERDFKNKERT